MPTPEPSWLEVASQLLKIVGAPVAVALGVVWLIRKSVLPKANGPALAKVVTEVLAAGQKDLLHHIDIENTEHFDQLRRDLTTTIENQQKLTRDDLRNALATMTLELELGRLREGDK